MGRRVLRPAGAPRGAVLATALVAAALVAARPAASQQDELALGRAVYERWCAGCHGAEGRGDGPAAAYMLPRPRDFTRGTYQIKSTASGALPTDADILRTIDEGMPGTAMPGWREKLTRQQRQAVLAYLKSLSPFFASEPAPAPLAVGRAPRVTAEGLEVGREVFDRLECWRCHGAAGRGDGPSAHEQVDDDGFPVRPADLHKSWRFTGGGRAEDVYLRLLTGLEGTPMPSQADAVASGVVSEEELWRLAQYVRSLSPERAPRVREVVRAGRVEPGAVPAAPDDEAWAAAEEFYLPLVGQVIVRPRWFAPSVSGVWVRALHDGETLALRLRWHDPSRSPEPRWREWQERVLATMEPREGGPLAPEPLPDAFAVQFPREIPTGMDRPYFLMGTARDPVYLWHWESATGARQALGRGLGRLEPLAPPAGAALAAEARWRDGEWSLVFRRSLRSGDEAPTGPIALLPGRTIPVAFFAWDGDNGEADTRAAISTWYYLHLDEPASRSVLVAPLSATLLTLALGLAVVLRAQRRPTPGSLADAGPHQPRD